MRVHWRNETIKKTSLRVARSTLCGDDFESRFKIDTRIESRKRIRIEYIFFIFSQKRIYYRNVAYTLLINGEHFWSTFRSEAGAKLNERTTFTFTGVGKLKSKNKWNGNATLIGMWRILLWQDNHALAQIHNNNIDWLHFQFITIHQSIVYDEVLLSPPVENQTFLRFCSVSDCRPHVKINEAALHCSIN